jgi:hypothetical protein
MQLTNEQVEGLNKAGRQYELATGDTLADFLQASILDVLYGGSLGILATAADVDSLAKGGGAFTWDAVTSSLTFGYGAGRVHNGKTMVSVSAGSIALSASATNYVEVTRAGVVSSNTTAFTSGRMPLYTVVTGVGTISTVTNSKPLMTLIGPNGVDGSMQSTPGQTKEENLTVGTIATGAATYKFNLRVPTTIGTGAVSKISWVDKEALAASDTNYVKWHVVNKGAAGAGTTVLVDDTAAANSTKATGGSALATYTPRDLTLPVLSIGTERDVTGGDVLEITITAIGTLVSSLTQSSMLFEFTYQN